MKRLLLAILILLAGCGARPTECPGIGPDAVVLVYPVTCPDVAADWNAARMALLGMGLSDPALHEWQIIYHPGGSWTGMDGLQVTGVTTPQARTIEVAAGARCTLTHEAFHAYEWDVLHVSNPTHAGWQERGWFDAVRAVCVP